MININIFKVDYAQISSAIQSFAAADQCGKGLNFIVMSLETLKRIEYDNLHLINLPKTLDFSYKIMGIPIAIDNTLELGEIRIV